MDQAVAIFESFNIDFRDGPSLHYLITDSSGTSVLVEFYQGEMHVIDNQSNWQQATNFILSSTGETPQGHCWRYDRIYDQLSEKKGRMMPSEAIELLAEVAQDATQWSVVYEMNSGDIQIVLGKKYDDMHLLHLDLQSK